MHRCILYERLMLRYKKIYVYCLTPKIDKKYSFFTNIRSSFFKREQDYCFIELSCFVQCNIWVKNDNTNGAEVNYLDLWCNCILSARKNLSLLPEQEEYCYIKTEMIMDPLCHFELPITTWKYFFVITIYDTWYKIENTHNLTIHT